MNYGDLKLFVLQKMFAVTGTSVVVNSSTTPYINSMPSVTNEALQLCSTAGKYIIKSVDITQDGTDPGIVKKYDLKALAPDFYSIGNNKVYFNDGTEYKPTTEYSTEGASIFVVPSIKVGTWTVYYNSYPTEITSATADNFVIDVDREVAAILPLYIASQLYKDDDVSLATQWRNEFESAFEKLVPTQTTPTVEFSVTWGW